MASTSTLGFSLQALAADLSRRVGEIYRGDSGRSRAQRDAVATFAVRVASAAILYLSQVVLARWMGGFEYGIYVFVWTWVLVLSGISHLGMPTAMIRLLPEYLQHGEHGLLRGLLLGGRAVAVLSGTAVAGAAMVVIWLVGARLNSHYALPIFLALACVPLCALSDVQDGIGRGRGWMAVGLMPPYILRPRPRRWCRCCWSSAGSRARSPGGPVSAYLTPTEVGMYFAAAKTMSLIMFIHYAVGSAVANHFAAFKARGDHESLEALVRDAVNWTFWPSLAAAIVILALGKPLLWLFSPQFTEAYPVMFVLAVGFLVRASMGPAEFILNMLGEQQLCALVLVVSAVLDVALSFALVPVFGMIGAAVATSVALVTAAIMNYVVARRRLELEISIWNSSRGR